MILVVDHILAKIKRIENFGCRVGNVPNDNDIGS